ncbi:MAG: M48 family metalloprotease, partial [bacterium]|nr:M48 family metalloprotease [bacterium]
MQWLQRAVLASVVTVLTASCATTSSFRVHMSKDVGIQRRVHQIGMRLGSIASRAHRRSDIAWRFGAVEHHPFGASASHDGLVGVDVFIASTFRPDELACVLSHEIGHVIKGHAGRGNTAEAVGGGFILAGTIASAIVAPWWTPFLVFFGGATISNASTASYERSLEEEADAFAVWLTIGAGYKPDACVRALERLNGLADHRQPFLAATVFATHPNLEDRIAFVRREA